MPRGIRHLARPSCIAGAFLLCFALPAQAQTVLDPAVQVEVVVTGLSQPTTMAFIGNGDFLVLQKADGRVRRVIGNVLQAGAVLDVAVDSNSERGLLGIALDPDFPVNGRVFLYYTESSTGSDTNGSPAPLGNRVYSYTWNGSALVNPQLVLSLPVLSGPNHNGGVLTFGKDGALYVVIGDLNHSGKLQNFPTGNDPDDTGVIFRVDTNGAPLSDNPFFNPANPSTPMGRYYAYGIRNSFGLTIDPVTGNLWESENGPNVYDEINRIIPGMNGGWTQIMGPDSRDPQGQADLWVAPGSTYSDPEFSWSIPVAPTALTFPTSPIAGCRQFRNLIVGDNNCGQLYRFVPNAARDALSFTSMELQDLVADNNSNVCADEMSEIILGNGFGVVTDLEPGPDGWIYAVSLFSGVIYRIGPKPGAFADGDGDSVADACDCAVSDPGSYSAPVEVPRLRAAASIPATLSWDSQSGNAGPGTVYSVVTGDLLALRADHGFASACTLRRGLPATSLVDSRPDPPAGSAYYYLARAENTCGNGTFGNGSGSPDPRDPLDAALPPDCPPTTGGALIDLGILSESLRVWSTNDTFIDRAKQHLANGTRQVPIFNKLLDGRTYDPQWTWHVDSLNMGFADSAVEVCDGLPSHIEANKNYWINTVGSYCPWSALVRGVDDRR